MRADFTLTLLLPPQLVSIGNGSPRPPVPHTDGLTQHVWQLDTPVPSYLYGFAGGPFTHAQQTAGKTLMQYFGPQPFTPESLQKEFAETSDMLAFYFGIEAYPDNIEAARTKYLVLKAAGLDRSLVFPDRDNPTDERSFIQAPRNCGP